ncbi:glycosyltransferase [uncultured Acetatifactor sp.]|uniref:glycosyltransferase n=1 Tax=uncultured Acetatifactor sp. TaxID=1671927 RepID=UPI00261C0F0A|nr:glycosyltransferase [uncultured Acetatifactor sp.]
MTVSVCMGIYNGEKYIEEQLDSILRQTRRAEEVILCDDCSTDRTVEIVRLFIERNGLQESWRLYCNGENRGYPGNFYYVMGLCAGDVVFLADQDDVWAETKLERMCAVLEEHPEAEVLACKFGLMDGEGERIHAVMAPSRSLGTRKLRQVGLREIFRKYQWPGMVLAYRNGWYRERGMGICGQESPGPCGEYGSRSHEDVGQCGEERNRSCEDAGPCGEYGSRSREDAGHRGEYGSQSREDAGHRGEYGSRSHEDAGQCGEDRSGPCGNGGLEFRVPHDIFLCAMAAEEGAFFHMDEELAHHRRHDSNTAAEEHRVGKLLQRERKLWEIEKYLRMLGEFEERRVLRTEAGKRILREKTRAMEGRYEALQSGRIWQVLRAAARDWRQVRAVAVVCDLMIVRGGRE